MHRAGEQRAGEGGGRTWGEGKLEEGELGGRGLESCLSLLLVWRPAVEAPLHQRSVDGVLYLQCIGT